MGSKVDLPVDESVSANKSFMAWTLQMSLKQNYYLKAELLSLWTPSYRIS